MQSARRIMTFGMCLVFGIVADSQAGRVEWVPVSATGPHTINGNSIVLGNTSGMQVTLELHVSNWDPEHDNDPTLSAVQATLDSTGFNNGSGINIGPVTTPSPAAGAFIAVSRCTVGQQLSPLGVPCDIQADCPGGEFCVGNPAYIFDGFNPIPVLALGAPNYIYGAVAQVGSRPDDANKYYAGTLILNIPATAKGTYTIGFYNDEFSNFTFMNNAVGEFIPVTQMIPALIKVPCTSGAACNDNNPCTFDRCTSGTCSSTARPVGFDCSDGLFCNGSEACNGAGVCLAGNPSCVGLPNAVCDESLGCVGPGNFNGDESLNLEDWFDFASCLTGPGIPGSSPCIPARMDNGTDVDLVDGAAFLNLFTGP